MGVAVMRDKDALRFVECTEGTAADAADLPLQLLTPASGRRVSEPECGWEAGLNRLIVHSRCPWCAYPTWDFRVTPHGSFAWTCYLDCAERAGRT